jgi:hypothetical protein
MVSFNLLTVGKEQVTNDKADGITYCLLPAAPVLSRSNPPPVLQQHYFPSPSASAS